MAIDDTAGRPIEHDGSALSLPSQCHLPYRHGVARKPKNFAIEVVGNVRPHERAFSVRVSPTAFVPSRFTAWVVLAQPRVRVDVELAIPPDGRQPIVRELTVTPGVDFAAPISTTTLRRILVDQIVRAVMAKAAAISEGHVVDRSDIGPGMYQLVGDPEDNMRFTPPMTADQLTARAAQVYREAQESGSRAPTGAVAAALGYSRSQASRYVRAAREAGLLPRVEGK
jgi:hypothetical protein